MNFFSLHSFTSDSYTINDNVNEPSSLTSSHGDSSSIVASNDDELLYVWPEPIR